MSGSEMLRRVTYILVDYMAITEMRMQVTLIKESICGADECFVSFYNVHTHPILSYNTLSNLCYLRIEWMDASFTACLPGYDGVKL